LHIHIYLYNTTAMDQKTGNNILIWPAETGIAKQNRGFAGLNGGRSQTFLPRHRGRKWHRDLGVGSAIPWPYPTVPMKHPQVQSPPQ